MIYASFHFFICQNESSENGNKTFDSYMLCLTLFMIVLSVVSEVLDGILNCDI